MELSAQLLMRQLFFYKHHLFYSLKRKNCCGNFRLSAKAGILCNPIGPDQFWTVDTEYLLQYTPQTFLQAIWDTLLILMETNLGMILLVRNPTYKECAYRVFFYHCKPQEIHSLKIFYPEKPSSFLSIFSSSNQNEHPPHIVKSRTYFQHFLNWKFH